MKSRDEFLESIYEKEKIALSRHKIQKKRFYRWSAAAAACMVIALCGIGIDDFDMSLADGADGDNGAAYLTEEASPEELAKSGVESTNNDDDKRINGEKGVSGEKSADLESLPGGENGSSGGKSPAQLPGADGTDGTDGTDGADKITGYYCLPVAIVVEDGQGKKTHYNTDEKIRKGMDWIYTLVVEGKAAAEEDLTAKEKKDFVYKVTAVCSMPEDPDSADADRIYYIFTDVDGFW